MVEENGNSLALCCVERLRRIVVEALGVDLEGRLRLERRARVEGLRGVSGSVFILYLKQQKNKLHSQMLGINNIYFCSLLPVAKTPCFSGQVK